MRGKFLLAGGILAAVFLISCGDSDESVTSAKTDKQETAGDFVANGLGFGSARARVETIVMEEGPDMLNYGHINLTVPADSFLKTFEYGDIVTVMLDGYDTIAAPVVGNYDDVRDQISKEIIVGAQPDIAYCYPDHVAFYNVADAVAQLDNLIDQRELVVLELFLNVFTDYIRVFAYKFYIEHFLFSP